jgi:hypothetical protein
LALILQHCGGGEKECIRLLLLLFLGDEMFD